MGDRLFQNSGAEGMVLVVVRNKQVFFRGYGETAPRSHQTPDANSVLRLCSLTKIFTSDLLTKMAAEKTLSLNDPLQRYAPQQITVPGRQPITLFQLATHTSGLPREVGFAQDGTAFTFPDRDTRWEWLPKQHPRFVPGTAAHYSNVGYDLLSDAMAAAGHKPYATLLDEGTLKPLHMYQTTFYPNPDLCGRLMVPSREVSPCTVTDATQGSSGLYSTANDMAQWLKYLLGSATPAIPAQPAAAQALYLTPEQLHSQQGMNAGGLPSGLGLGWVHLNDPATPSHLIQKTGGGAGFLTYIVIHPESHTALFLAVTVGPHTSHSYYLFKGANSAILELAGLPPMPEEPTAPRKGARGAQHRAAPDAAHKTKQPAAPAAKTAPRSAHKAVPESKSKRAEKPVSKSAAKTATKSASGSAAAKPAHSSTAKHSAPAKPVKKTAQKSTHKAAAKHTGQ